MVEFSIVSGPVHLGVITPRSAHQLFRLASDPDLTTYLQWEPHRTVDDSIVFINDSHRLWERRSAYIFGIFNAGSGQLLGTTAVSHIDRPNRMAEVGTWIGVPFQGKGYNLHAKAAAFAFGFDVLRLHRLEMLVKADNRRSYAATKKLPGVFDEGLLHGRIWKNEVAYDAHLLAITRDSFDASAYPRVDVAGSFA